MRGKSPAKAPEGNLGAILRCDVGLVGIPWDYLLRMGLVLVLISITMIIITMIRINNVYKMK